MSIYTNKYKKYEKKIINLFENTGGYSALIIIAKRSTKYTAIILELLIDSGADINAQTSDKKFTALHYLCGSFTKYSYDCIRILIKAGADINLPNDMLQTSLIILCTIRSGNSMKTFDLLLASGADINSKDIVGRTCLHALCCTQSDEIVYRYAKKLIKRGIDINHQSNIGSTCLMILSHNRHYKSIKLFLKTSCIDINLRDNKGNTALHYFCDETLIGVDVGIINLFMYKNYDETIANIDGNTVYQCYMTNKDPNFNDETLELLLQGKMRLSNVKSCNY